MMTGCATGSCRPHMKERESCFYAGHGKDSLVHAKGRQLVDGLLPAQVKLLPYQCFPESGGTGDKCMAGSSQNVPQSF